MVCDSGRQEDTETENPTWAGTLFQQEWVITLFGLPDSSYAPSRFCIAISPIITD
jgi:hypothetical protein